ncbi:9580_t:CDS:1 [Cetraspora pellucida]|uniref:9580_t:CDS:1 n=1 Tax=Cetraspora pellucida TaxID=1433469 RepID=A0A9N9BN49_9GLOM|nr:9580_t:CDS:1 [Cetraspora pellucida]
MTFLKIPNNGMMDINKSFKSSDIFNPENSRNSSSTFYSESPIISVGPYGTFHDYGSFVECFCDQCNGCRVPLYTCKGENCKIKCPPHTRKCSECADHNYLAKHRINRKYYTSRKSRLNSENSISFKGSLINKSTDSINDVNLSEIPDQ